MLALDKSYSWPLGWVFGRWSKKSTGTVEIFAMLWRLTMPLHSALGLSHALGHKLGAKYGIPHGITSVGYISYALRCFNILQVSYAISNCCTASRNSIRWGSGMPSRSTLFPSRTIDRLCRRGCAPSINVNQRVSQDAINILQFSLTTI